MCFHLLCIRFRKTESSVAATNIDLSWLIYFGFDLKYTLARSVGESIKFRLTSKKEAGLVVRDDEHLYINSRKHRFDISFHFKPLLRCYFNYSMIARKTLLHYRAQQAFFGWGARWSLLRNVRYNQREETWCHLDH